MSAEAAKTNQEAHRVIVEERGRMEVRGVTDVISFDDQAVLLKTSCGEMCVEGTSLHINVLSLTEGLVTLDGHVDQIAYYDRQSSDQAQKRGFFGRLLR